MTEFTSGQGYVKVTLQALTSQLIPAIPARWATRYRVRSKALVPAWLGPAHHQPGTDPGYRQLFPAVVVSAPFPTAPPT